jgi:peptide/nickel transport system ATP-binding protein
MLAVLRAEDVGKTYESGLIFRKRHQVLQAISLQMEEGRTVGLMGASGSGKTTLGKIIAGLERPSSGRVLYEDEDIRGLQGGDLLAFRRQVQMVFQDPEGSLNPRKSIESSIHEVLSLLKTPAKRWQEKTAETLEMVGLSEEIFCRYPAQISGGQCQRVALGRVLLLRPRVLILDEPTSALDISVQAQILGLLKKLQKEMDLAYLIITHQPEVIRFMADETIVLNGRGGALI